MSLVVIETAELKTLISNAVEEAVRDALAHAPGNAPAPDLVSGAAMAKRLDVSRATMHRMRLEGCPALRVGDSYKYQPAKVLAWVEARNQARQGAT